jgi:predicted glycogen debranching enzyme
MQAPSGPLEWLCTNRHGSFALGSSDRRLRRKYHGLLTVREPGCGAPWSVLAEVHEGLTYPDGSGELLCDALYGNLQPASLASFQGAPRILHSYRTTRGIEIERELKLSAEHDQVELTYRVRGVREALELSLSPLLRCRGMHDLTRENPFLDGSFSNVSAQELRMLPYQGMPGLAFAIQGASFELRERGTWHTGVHYPWEAERGYEAMEDLFCPGAFCVALERDTELTFLVAVERCVRPGLTREPVGKHAGLQGSLERAAEQFAMRAKNGASAVIAGYPWFGPWGRDTLIALPGLHLAWGDTERTLAVLESLLAARVNGLIPNIPAIGGETANTCSVDATLLFVRAVQWLAQQEGADVVSRFMPALCDMLDALAEGGDSRMRFDDGIGIRTERGPWAMTWMDAMIGGWPVTPRAGYAIDIDALAYNAAHFVVDWAEPKHAAFARAFKPRLKDAEARFLARYWDERHGHLADCHDGQNADFSLRPNLLWALGLPYRPVPAQVAKSSLEAVTRDLLTPAGLRTLSPKDPAYRGHYRGTQDERDRAYHQGTVWPWLLGIYADAVVATLGRDALEPLMAPSLAFFAQHLDHEGCVGQVSEVFSGDGPHEAGGTPAQAWSVSELLRVHKLLSMQTTAAGKSAAKKSAPHASDMVAKR